MGTGISDYIERDIRPAPPSLVEAGKFAFGTFSSHFEKVNPLDALHPLGDRVPRGLLPYRLKEWQAFQLGNSRWFMLAVLYNAKISALAQFVAYDRERGKRYVFEKLLPAWKIKVPGDIWDSAQAYSDREGSIELISALRRGRFYINVRMGGGSGRPPMEGHFEAFHDTGLVEPIVVSIPLGENRAMYSHKCLMPMQGSLVIGGEEVVFSKKESFAIIDDHKGFYPYMMHYDWLTAAGYDTEGRLSGFNLTDNQSADPEKYNENCLWVDGRLFLLPPVKFDRPQGVDGEWRVRDLYGMVDLSFRPVSMGKIDMNLLAVKVSYFGPFGVCGGRIRDSLGREHSFDGYFGMGEKKFVRG